jgi:hypothetical protein
MFEVRHARSAAVNNFAGTVNRNAYAGRVWAIKLGYQGIDGESLWLPDLWPRPRRTEYQDEARRDGNKSQSTRGR